LKIESLHQSISFVWFQPSWWIYIHCSSRTRDIHSILFALPHMHCRCGHHFTPSSHRAASLMIVDSVNGVAVLCVRFFRVSILEWPWNLQEAFQFLFVQQTHSSLRMKWDQSRFWELMHVLTRQPTPAPTSAPHSPLGTERSTSILEKSCYVLSWDFTIFQELKV
jgi:hypothetical protein